MLSPSRKRRLFLLVLFYSVKQQLIVGQQDYFLLEEYLET